MTRSEHGDSEKEKATLFGELWNIFLLGLRALQPLLVLAMLAIVFWAALSKQSWPFSIEATIEHLSLSLTHEFETKWRIDGAVLCTLDPIAALKDRSADNRLACPSTRWNAYSLTQLEEPVLIVPSLPVATSAYSASLDIATDGSLSMQLRKDALNDPNIPKDRDIQAISLAWVDANTGIEESSRVRRDVILKFSAPTKDSAQRVLFPFVGSGSIGKDVSWKDSAILRSGRVSLYTHSVDSAGGRALVATAELMPGDRVDLYSGKQADDLPIKGFVHVDVAPRSDGSVPVMRVVAFGESESVHIVRFGDQGYDFAPSVMARLTRHHAVSTWAVLVFSLLSLMAVYSGGSKIGDGTFSESLRRLRARFSRVESAEE